MNWAGYIDYWDKFIQKWIDDPIALAQNDPLICNKVDIDDIIDLPEPYYCGVPLQSELDAVIINLNPGKSSSEEWIKYHCFLGDSKAIISYGLSQKGNSYSNVVNKSYNPLLKSTRNDVPGKKWWESRRLKWLDDFYPHGGRNATNGYRPERVFAMEYSPWHSKSSVIKPIKSLCGPLRKHIDTYIIEPMADAINRSRLKGGFTNKPYGLCFSKVVYDILTSFFSFKPIARWDSTTTSIANKWPRSSNGKATDRTYTLIEGFSPEGQYCRLLCLWYGNVGVSAPSKAFYAIEQHIKAAI